MNFTRSHLILLIGLIILGCSEWDLDRIEFTKVITIGAIEVGSNSAFLIGDIENIRESSIVESGFVLTSTLNADSTLRLNFHGVIPFVSPGLDTISEDRAFAARATDLNGSTEYFFRAYVKIAGEEQVAYGGIDQFTTAELIVSLKSVKRASEGCPTTAEVEIQVEGFAPGGSTEVGIVFSEDLSNLSPSIENGSLVIGNNIDPSGLINVSFGVECMKSYAFRVVVNPESPKPQYSNDYAFTMIDGGQFVERNEFLGRIRKGKPVSFAYGGNGFMGGGEGLGTDENRSRMWKYDASIDNWEDQGQFDNLNISESVSILYGDRIYITSGLAPLTHCGKTGTNDLPNGGLDMDGNNHTWSSLCSACQGSSCTKCGQLRYVATGSSIVEYAWYGCQCYNQTTLVFDPSENTIQFQDIRPIGIRTNAFTFQIQNNPYIFGGENYRDPSDLTDFSGFQICAGVIRECVRSTLKFSPESTLSKDAFPGLKSSNLAGFVVGDLAYVGLGIECPEDKLIEGENDESIISPVIPRDEIAKIKNLFAFNPQSPPESQWNEVQAYPGNGENVMTFSSANKGFVVFKSSDSSNILWQFDPLAGPMGEWTQLDAIPNPLNQDADPYHLFTLGNISYIYFSTSRDNFWMYVPELD